MTLRALVYSALDNALDSGYDMTNVETQEVVDDLQAYDAVMENELSKDIFPFVKEWQTDRRK